MKDVNFRKLVKYFIYIKVLIFIDQFSKHFFLIYLKHQPGYLLELLPFLDIVHAWNYGISFGLFREYFQYSNYAFLGLNSIIIGYLIYLLNKASDNFMIYSLILIIGGAMGNLMDRLFRGAVFDFIYFHYHNLFFPAFNFADSFITIGAGIFIYDHLFNKKHLEEKYKSR